MDRKEPPMKQQTKPKKGKPMEIPVPKRAEFDRLLAKAAKRPRQGL